MESDNKTTVVNPTGDDRTQVSAAPSDRGFAIDTDAAPRPTVGTVINQRFTLRELLGSGGMGQVYRAIDQRKQEARDDNPYIAIKLLGGTFASHPSAFVALQREAKKHKRSPIRILSRSTISIATARLFI